jgi:hypothetical protein
VNGRLKSTVGDDVASQLAAKSSGKISIHAGNLMAALGITGFGSGTQFQLTGGYSLETLLSEDSAELVRRRRKVLLLLSLQSCLRKWPRQHGYIDTAPLSHVDVAHEKASIAALQQQCEIMLDAFPTSIEVDESLLAVSSVELGPRLRQAVAARLECKLNLAAALELFATYEQVYS